MSSISDGDDDDDDDDDNDDDDDDNDDDDDDDDDDGKDGDDHDHDDTDDYDHDDEYDDDIVVVIVDVDDDDHDDDDDDDDHDDTTYIDLVFILLDRPDETHDKLISEHIMNNRSFMRDSRTLDRDRDGGHHDACIKSEDNSKRVRLNSSIYRSMNGSMNEMRGGSISYDASTEDGNNSNMTLSQRLRRQIKEVSVRTAREPCVYLNRGKKIKAARIKQSKRERDFGI